MKLLISLLKLSWLPTRAWVSRKSIWKTWKSSKEPYPKDLSWFVNPLSNNNNWDTMMMNQWNISFIRQDMSFRRKGFSDHAMWSICKRFTNPKLLKTNSKLAQYWTKGKIRIHKNQPKTQILRWIPFILRSIMFGSKWFWWNLKCYNWKTTVRSSNMW